MFFIVRGVQYEIIEENNIKVYKDYYCHCPCNKRIPIKEWHKRNGIPNYIDGHQQKSLEVRERISKSKIGKSPTAKAIENMRKGQLGRKHTLETIQKIKEKRKLQIITEETKQKIKKTQTGKTLEEIHGKEKSDIIKNKIGKKNKGKSYEELYGLEKSNEIKEKRSRSGKRNKGKHHTLEAKIKMSKSQMGRRHSSETKKKLRISSIKRTLINNGKFPSYNLKQVEYFRQFDIDHDTNGQYATSPNEYLISEIGYFPDYINFDLKIIIEWDEERHFDENGNLHEHDIQRQKEIQQYFPDFEFRRIREKEEMK